jgi:uncharacterized protein
MSTDSKLDDLIDRLGRMGSVLLAYSGGLDSTFLLKAVELSGVRALAVTASSETTPPHDLEDARDMASLMAVRHMVVETREMEDENFLRNSPDRCFHCKDGLYGRLNGIARDEGLAFVLDGSNLDDRDDYRPGMEAARMHGVRSPLMEAGFTKDEIRDVSKKLSLRTWDKPSSACLSSRLPYGTRITAEALRRIAGAEACLRALGFASVRVREHGDVARIEVDKGSLSEVLEHRRRIAGQLRQLGYRFVSLDIEGFRSGTMNRVLE